MANKLIRITTRFPPMSYDIRYHHTGPVTVATIEDAKRAVTTEAVRVRQFADAVTRVVFVPAEDGIYAYLEQADADADESGAAAFAVIETGSKS